MPRPRKSGERYRGGKLKRPRPTASPIDRGHELVLDKRRALAGGDGRDPRAGYPLGIAVLRGLISDRHHNAGLQYALLASIVFGDARTAASHLRMLVPTDAPERGNPAATEAWVAKKEAEFHRVVATLQELPTKRPFRILENVVRYEHYPRFLDPERRHTPAALRADQADRDALYLALGILAAFWQIEPDDG